jgi:hypothetical protein
MYQSYLADFNRLILLSNMTRQFRKKQRHITAVLRYAGKLVHW